MNYAIIVAAGQSSRMKVKVDKAFVPLGSKPVLAYSMIAYEECPEIDGIIVVVKKDRIDSTKAMAKMFGCSKLETVVTGGSKRQLSVARGIEKLPRDVSIVAVHDGARPLITPELISASIKAAKRYGSGVAGCRMTDTIKFVESGLKVTSTLDRNKVWAVQTPQTFKVKVLKEAYEYIDKNNLTVTDEASALEVAGLDVHLVESETSNMKITTLDDLTIAAALLKL